MISQNLYNALGRLYAGYPVPEDGLCDFTVRLEPERVWRRFLRPSVALRGDYVLPDAAPLALAHGLLAAEMGMNLQMAHDLSGHRLPKKTMAKIARHHGELVAA